MEKTSKTFKKLAKLQLENPIDLAPGNIYWKDTQGIYLGCNNNFLLALKLPSRQALLGKTNYDLLTKELADVVTANDQLVYQSGKEQVFEELGIGTNGKRAIYLTRKTPLFGDDGQVVGLLGNSIQKPACFQLEDIMALAPGNIYWKDTQGVYLGCNNNFLLALKLSSRQALVGKTDYDLSAKELADPTTANDQIVYQSGKEQIFEETGIGTDGKQAIYLTKKTPLFDDDGQVVGLLGVSIDITDRKNQEEALRIAKDEAVLANQLKTDFIINMQHDIRTPLGYVAVYGGKLVSALEHSTDAKLKKYAEYVSISGARLMETVDETFSFFDTETGTPGVTVSICNLAVLAEELVALFKIGAKQKNIGLIFENSGDSLLTKAKTDALRVRHIIMNLIDNAIKFTQKGQVKVKLSAVKKSKSKPAAIILKVSDTGIGIPPGQQHIIYEKFVRLDPSNRNAYKGLGVGLAVVKKFVEELNGTIVCESTPAVGTTFICTIPMQVLKRAS